MTAFILPRLAGGLLLATAALSWAAAPSDEPLDYSHTVAVTVSGRAAVVQLPLPRAVYLAARSPGLADLRLFD